MQEDQFQILVSFYEKLSNSISRVKGKTKHISLLFTLIELNSKDCSKFLNQSNFSTSEFTQQELNMLMQSGYIRELDKHSVRNEFVLTAQGIWEVEKKLRGLEEKNLIDFIQHNYLVTGKEQKPLVDKEKIVIFALLSLRMFSKNVLMDLNLPRYRDEWGKIMNIAFEFLNTNHFLKTRHSNSDSIFPSTSTEHFVQYLMRRRNDLPIKTNQVFCFNGNYQYFLDIDTDNSFDESKLIRCAKLVFNEISDKSSLNLIINMTQSMAHEYSKYVTKNFQYVNHHYDEIIEKSFRAIYLN